MLYRTCADYRVSSFSMQATMSVTLGLGLGSGEVYYYQIEVQIPDGMWTRQGDVNLVR